MMLHIITFKEILEQTRVVGVEATDMTHACEKLAKLLSPSAKEFHIISIEKEETDHQAQADITMGTK
jgi:hypothetical protein